MPAIDLKILAARESEQVEWKENVASISDVVKTVVAFANDYSNLGGGYVVCGAAERKDEHGFSRVELPGLAADRFHEVEGKVLAECRQCVDPPVVPLVEPFPAATPDRRGLIFVVPASRTAHSYRAHGKDASTYYIRMGRATVEAKNGLLRELLVRKGVQEPWDRRLCAQARPEDIDPLVLREYLQRMDLWDPGRPFDDYLSPSMQLAAFAPPLCGQDPLTGALRPRNFALLMFGRAPTRFFPGAYSIFSIYPGPDRSEPHAERLHLEGTLIEQTTRLITQLNTQSYALFDKQDRAAPNLLKYPQRALQEATINALVHRDYESDQPVRVTVFSDRIEIYSPGSLPTGVDPARFQAGQATPVWRNQALAYFFNKLQLAQAEGQGIPTILRLMREEGCPPPRFDIGKDSLLCTLPAHPRHERMREHREIERSIILRSPEEAARRAEALLDRDPYDFRAIELFCEGNALLGAPRQVQVYEFIRRHRLDPHRLNIPTQVLLAERLSGIETPSQEIQDYIKLLLNLASNNHLQEVEARRVALALRRVGNHEEAVAVVDRVLRENPGLKDNASLLRLRGEARIDLAKRCMETGRDRQASARIRGRAWEEARAFLEDAERDLRTALEHESSAIDQDYLRRGLEFLRRLREQARRPRGHRGQHRGHDGGGGRGSA